MDVRHCLAVGKLVVLVYGLEYWYVSRAGGTLMRLAREKLWAIMHAGTLHGDQRSRALLDSRSWFTSNVYGCSTLLSFSHLSHRLEHDVA